jgi:CheY-like chemotaxis protein
MTAVIGWAKLLRTETDPDTIAEAAGAIERSAAAQAQLIDDILDVARIRTGKLRMHFETVNVADVVQAAVETVRLTADAKDIRLHVQADSGVLPVRGDPQRLQQVVWNLLTHAVKFTPEGGRIDVSLEWVNSTARITVRDTGAGIAPAFLPHLFERFRQAETTQRRGLGGLGLGLSIAEYIVTAHGGSIRAQSAGEGQGATFIVDLPIAIEKSGREPRSPSRATDEVESLQGVSVLVVEDDADTLLYFRHAFGRAGAVVTGASSVDEALEMFRANEPDVVVSDIAMPEKSGYDLVQAIRQSGWSVPIIAVTASGAMGDRDRALSAGFDVYLRKPVEPRELIHAVRQAVDAAR